MSLFFIVGTSYSLFSQCNTDAVCDATETYCVCTDCNALCASANAVFIQMQPNIALAADPIAYCPIELGGSNTTPETVFIPIAPFAGGDLDCVSWLVSPSEGEVFRSTGTPVDADPASNDGVVDDGFIFYLSITDAQIAASGGTTIITYTAQNDPNATACTFTSQINWNGTILQSDVTTAFVSATAQCPACNNDAVCDANENYCSCVDCSSLCSSAVDVFVDMAGPSISTDAIAYCPLERGLTNTSPETVMVALAPLSTGGDLGCVTWEVAPSQGEIFVATNPPSDADPASNNGDITDGFIYFLVIDDAGIAAAPGGITTITYTALNDINSPPCTFSSTIDWNGTILQSDLTAWTGSAMTQCPDICTPLAGSLLSYDCATNMASFDVTDAGTPPPGTNYELIQTNDASVAAVPVTGVGTFMVGPIDPTVTFSIGAQSSGGGPTNCNVQTGAIYPDCYVLPVGCSDVLAGTGDMETSAAWVEVSDTTNTVTGITDATGIPNIDPALPLAGAQSAFLGGWGGTSRTSLTSITQSVTFGVAGETATLIFWFQIAGCDSADDMIDISIDGISIYSTDAVSAYPMTTNGAAGICGDGQWYEITIPLGTTFSDGASHTIVITATEAATNGNPSTFFIDEMVIESCGMACPPEFTLAAGTRLIGTETGVADYETDGILESQQTIDATADVDYDSALEITLFPGFNTIQGALFHAFIDGCMGLMFDDGNSEKVVNGNSGRIQLRDQNAIMKRTIQSPIRMEQAHHSLRLSR